MGIFWFRVHNWWAEQLNQAYPDASEEFLFNRARQFTIASYQVCTREALVQLLVPKSYLYLVINVLSNYKYPDYQGVHCPDSGVFLCILVAHHLH